MANDIYTRKSCDYHCQQIVYGMPSYGSQVRKTNNEKELVLVRVEKNGIPVYFVVALLEMAEFGGTDAISLKKDLDSVA